MSTPSGSLEAKYEVLAKIREGGMGAIYKVRHRLLNEPRVIKVMRPEVAQSAEQRKRFFREAQTATRLRHPNIVAFYDFFVDEEDTAYMVMEYIDGINLRDALRGCGPFPVPLATEVSRQCLAAFEYLHRRKIVHRDVSPDNVMMTREEDGTLRAKLIDLGIAKIAQAKEELTGADEFIGKLKYSSPEQLTKSAVAGQIDGRSDLYSMGLVIYELLTGISPYSGDSVQEIIGNRLQEPPLSFDVSDPQGKLPARLKQVVMRSLEWSPGKRYATAAEFEHALAEFAGGGATDPAAEGYVARAMTLAAEAARSRKRGAGDLGPTLRADLAGADEAAESSRDRKFRSTIARWAADAPSSAGASALDSLARSREADLEHSPTAVILTDAEVPRGARPPSVRARPVGGRGSPIVRYGAVAAAAALLVAFGVWIAGRDPAPPAATAERDGRSTEAAPASQPPTSLPARDTSAAPAGDAPARVAENAPPISEPTSPPDRRIEEPTPPAAKPTALGARGTARSPGNTPAAKRPTPIVRVAQVPPTRPAASDAGGAAVPVPRDVNAPKMHYCAQFDDTVYKQGVTRDVPAGFEGIATKAPRPDSGLMKVAFSLSKERPADDEPFFVFLRFENGGDARVDVQRLEESASRGGMRAVSGASVPVTVSPGGIKEIHRYPLTLSGGEPYSKQFVVSDAKGDSWRTGLRLVPCAD